MITWNENRVQIGENYEEKEVLPIPEVLNETHQHHHGFNRFYTNGRKGSVVLN
jgi:hypothetical protein